MKSSVFLCLLLTCMLVVGCNSGATTPTEEASPSGAAGEPAGSEAAEEAADDSAAIPADAQDDLATTRTPPAATDSLEAPDLETPSDDEGVPSAPPTQADYQQQLMAAVQQQDMGKALEIVNAALTDFPEDVGMQVNRFLLRLRLDAETEGQDADAAAQQFIETAGMARELLELGDQLPDQGRRVVPYAFYNEARGQAHQGNVAESLGALRAAVEGGMEQLEFETDDFFASVRDNDEFKAGVDELMSLLKARMKEQAQREIEETESFAFDFELPDLDQNPVKLADFRGKLVIVDIWGTWCPPCREEIPHFIKLKDAYADDLAIVGINYEGEEGDEVVEKIRQFAQDQGINYPCVIGDQATQDQVPNLRGFPTTLFLDREGKVRLMIVGYHPYEKLDAYINVLLEEGGAG